MGLPIHTPSHKDSRPLKSALGNPKKLRGKAAIFAGFQSLSTITMTVTITSLVSTQTTTSKWIIQCLCTALKIPGLPGVFGEPSYGYLINDDISYYIYDIPVTNLSRTHGPTRPLGDHHHSRTG
ncbi:hypothetical protein QBC32DRAFT_115134 [Pseudoneurospora amorphoporcata]|uniref:Uncharacterized protein n=1 Tax=Pseudoneurospora amorphoporcata TaxID=241081 RepID=A0AAN6NJD3_9PEZI|nr:hypothetical protein QBC32DRAFT_115134 [Pseudoneurospora amorphoporcata]